MQGQAAHPNPLISYAITAVIVIAVMALRMRNVGRTRRLRLETLWIVPALYLLITIGTFVAMPPSGLAWLYIGVALVGGGALGWQRGRMMHIEVDPGTHTLNQRMSPAAMIFLVLLIAVRSGARILVENGTVHFNIAIVTDILIAFALGMFALQRLEMFLRAKRLLEEARGRGRTISGM